MGKGAQKCLERREDCSSSTILSDPLVDACLKRVAKVSALRVNVSALG